MVFKIPEIVEAVTDGLTLEPGDIIATGTPAGVGLERGSTSSTVTSLKHGSRVCNCFDALGLYRFLWNFFVMMRGASRHLDVSPVPLGSKGAHDPCVEWSVTTVNRRAEAQPALGKPTKT
ncbi:MAG: fumarylacetoacetate hydrolase family protein [Sulfolobales archaeon]